MVSGLRKHKIITGMEIKHYFKYTVAPASILSSSDDANAS